MAFTVEMARKLSNVDPQLREVLFSIIEEVERQRAVWEQSVIKSEFDELRAVVRDLTEAQRRTELRVEELAAAQKKTEERLEALTARVEELAAAQKKTEERLEALTARVEELAAAQKKTEERLDALTIRVDALALRVEELAAAQKKTEERLDALTARVDALTVRVEELAIAQKKTEERLDALTIRVDALALRVEELAEAQKRTEARLEELAAAQKRTEQMMQEGFQKLRDSIAALGSRWGIQTEDVFRRTIESLLAKEGFTVQRGYYGHREVDVVLRNGRHLLLEMTSFLRNADVDKLLASAEAYEAQTGVRPDLMIASSYVPASVMRRLLACGREIELISPEEEA